MPMDHEYEKPEPRREDVDQLPGATMLEFGAAWCGFCQGAQPAISEALSLYPDIRHIKVGDGPGKPLGRSFRVKLWPTLIFLKDGKEAARAVRPTETEEIRRDLAAISG